MKKIKFSEIFNFLQFLLIQKNFLYSQNVESFLFINAIIFNYFYKKTIIVFTMLDLFCELQSYLIYSKLIYIYRI
jgi:hypothetical protein